MDHPDHGPFARSALSRRRLLTIGGAGAVGLLAAGRTAVAAPRARSAGASAGKALNVIFMVSDGMSTGTLTLAEMYSQLTRGKPSVWVDLLNRKGVRRSSAFTYSADSLVTDSSAGASAWGIGRLVNNGAVNITPDGKMHTPILVQARQQGKMTGLVTTTTVTHATPAGFIANLLDRGGEVQIGAQLLQRGCDVVLGGGAANFPPDLLKASGFDVVRTRDELAKAPAAGRPLLGLFSDKHMSFQIERPATEPTLAEMTRAALARLEKSPNGFVVQIEGGRVDHAAHYNDAPSLVREQLSFDEAIGVVWEWTSRRDDTLVIMTSDHGNANPGMTVYGKKTREGLERLTRATHSFDWIGSAVGTLRIKDSDLNAADDPQHPGAKGDLAVAKAAQLVEQIRACFGITLSRSDVAVLQGMVMARAVDPFAERNGATSVLGSILSNYFGVGFLSGNHTSDMVEVTSWGPGCETVPPMLANKDLHEIMIKAMDLAPAKPV